MCSVHISPREDEEESHLERHYGDDDFQEWWLASYHDADQMLSGSTGQLVDGFRMLIAVSDRITHLAQEIIGNRKVEK
jgi:hypothetical protein